jgi:hypothetical protein
MGADWPRPSLKRLLKHSELSRRVGIECRMRGSGWNRGMRTDFWQHTHSTSVSFAFCLVRASSHAVFVPKVQAASFQISHDLLIPQQSTHTPRCRRSFSSLRMIPAHHAPRPVLIAVSFHARCQEQRGKKYLLLAHPSHLRRNSLAEESIAFPQRVAASRFLRERTLRLLKRPPCCGLAGTSG